MIKDKKIIIGILTIGIILIGGVEIWLNRDITYYPPYHLVTVRNITIYAGPNSNYHGPTIISKQEDIKKIISKLDYVFSHLKRVYYIDGIRKTPVWMLTISYDGQQFKTTCWLGSGCLVGNTWRQWCHFIEIDGKAYTFDIIPEEENELDFIFGDVYLE